MREAKDVTMTDLDEEVGDVIEAVMRKHNVRGFLIVYHDEKKDRFAHRVSWDSPVFGERLIGAIQYVIFRSLSLVQAKQVSAQPTFRTSGREN